ncbi:MAG: ABC transporter permease [Thermoproteota archaeon]
MSETFAIAEKEARTLLLSKIWNLGLVIVIVCSLAGIYQAYLSYQEQVDLYGKGKGIEPTSLSAFASSIWVVANGALPLLSIISTFDAVARERRAGTMQLLLTRSTSRGSIIVGKFLGGFLLVAVVSVSTVLLTSGLTIALVGPFDSEEELRILAFTLVTILYISIWVSISLFISTVIKSWTISLIVSLLLIVSLAGWTITSSALSNLLAPLPSFWIGGNAWYATISELNMKVGDYLNWFSPSAVFMVCAGSFLNPMVDVPPFVRQTREPIFPLGVVDTLINVWPCISTMITMLTVTLIASYVVMKTRKIETEGGKSVER